MPSRRAVERQLAIHVANLTRKLAMNVVCRALVAAALGAALCPAVGWAQSARKEHATYHLTDDSNAQLASASTVTAAAGPACEAACGGCSCCCDACCGGCGCLDWLSCWPCGCKLEDLGEACKLWKPCCE